MSSLGVGATVILDDGNPNYPDAGAMWKLVQDEKVTVFGLSASYINYLRGEGLEPEKMADLSSLTEISQTGSVLSAEGFEWVYRAVKKDLHFNSISGGTDINGCFAIGSPIQRVYAGELQGEGLGMKVQAYDENGKPVWVKEGELVCEASAPCMPLYFWNDPNWEKYKGAYFEYYPNWSRAMRMKYFHNPLAPDGRNYYAWETNNALFVALDPFWFSPRARRNDDNWFRTLGKAQYDWLKRTLETSNAKFKFVFIHHLVGGKDRQGRGGVEVASLYEWGGKNADGIPGFPQHRPGWPAPIHQLLVETGVSLVFHGHDHFYAHQERDAIAYQEVPQPGDARGGSVRTAVEYGYKSGTVQYPVGDLMPYGPMYLTYKGIQPTMFSNFRGIKTTGIAAHSGSYQLWGGKGRSSDCNKVSA